MANERLLLTQPIDSRDGTFTSDSYTSNCFFETSGSKKELVKRPGLSIVKQVTPVTPPSYLQSQGLFELNGVLYAVINNILYSINPNSGYTVNTVATLSSTTNNAYAVKTFLDTYLFIHNTANAYLIDQSGSTISMTNLPTGPYIPGAVLIDNYVFIATTNNRIYNCAIGDPTTWNSLSYVSFYQTTDSLMRITKHLNYLVAFGFYSTQFYYDNANTPPASPLSVAPSYIFEIGCANGDSVVSTNNTVFWVGNSKASGKSVYLMDGVSPVRISTNAIDKHLEKDGLGNVTAYCYGVSGHVLYILNLLTSQETLVYDVTEKQWYNWSQYYKQSSYQANPNTYQESFFRPSFFVQADNTPYILDKDVACIYVPNNETYQDNGQPIYYRSVTSIDDSGTTKRKFYSKVEIIGDKTAGTMNVSFSSNDYATYSNPRSIDLNASRSQIYMTGASRRRSWQFVCTDNVPLRLEAAEIEFRVGEMDQEQGVSPSSHQYRG